MENFYVSRDGSIHADTIRFHIETCHNTDHYDLPEKVGTIVHVKISGNDIPRAFHFLECPATTSYTRLFSINGDTPHDISGVRRYIRSVYDKLRRPLWYRFSNTLFLHPAPVNSGELLVIDAELVEI